MPADQHHLSMLTALYVLLPMAGFFVLLVRFFRRATPDRQVPKMSAAELAKQFDLADEFDAREREARRRAGR